MNLERLITFFSTNPTARLLRSPNAAYVVHFLNQHFKVEANLATPHSELQQRLGQYLEEIHETQPDVLRDRAEAYLTQWSTGESRWLRRFFDAQHAESVYELTPHTEDVLKFLTEILERNLGFVGTESRLTRIIDTLSDIVVRGSANRDRRIAHLMAERKRINDEIRSIQAGDVVSTHTPTAIRERFADVVSDLVSLQGDFRAVEESFKEITRDVQRQQSELADTRGNILGGALDAEDRLKSDDQGASFHAFVRLILSQNQQDELEKIIAQLDEIHELAAQLEGKQRVKQMIVSLSAEAEKVLHTTRRLSSTLRRLLDTRAGATRLQLAKVLRDIKATAARLAEDPPQIGIEVMTELDLLNVSQRTFWQAPVEFDEVALSNPEPDEDERMIAFRHLAEMRRLDWDAMQSNIDNAVRGAERVTLHELLEVYPPDGGSIEILGYIQLAHDGGHLVDDEHEEVIELFEPDAEGPPRPFEIPRVVFLSQRSRALVAAGSQLP